MALVPVGINSFEKLVPSAKKKSNDRIQGKKIPCTSIIDSEKFSTEQEFQNVGNIADFLVFLG